jgi:hypothetical protein
MTDTKPQPSITNGQAGDQDEWFVDPLNDHMKLCTRVLKKMHCVKVIH